MQYAYNKIKNNIRIRPLRQEVLLIERFCRSAFCPTPPSHLMHPLYNFCFGRLSAVTWVKRGVDVNKPEVIKSILLVKRFSLFSVSTEQCFYMVVNLDLLILFAKLYTC